MCNATLPLRGNPFSSVGQAIIRHVVRVANVRVLRSMTLGGIATWRSV